MFPASLPPPTSRTPFQTIVELLDLKPTLVRGNASEVAALAAAAGVAAPVGAGRGVDSNLGSADAALGAAKALASHLGCVVAVTGPGERGAGGLGWGSGSGRLPAPGCRAAPTRDPPPARGHTRPPFRPFTEDLVTDGARTARVANGVPLLSAITATGCSVTALCLASVAANKGGDVLVAVAAALAAFGVAAERGAATARGPASLRVALLDELYALEEEGFEAGAKVAWEGGS